MMRGVLAIVVLAIATPASAELLFFSEFLGPLGGGPPR